MRNKEPKMHSTLSAPAYLRSKPDDDGMPHGRDISVATFYLLPLAPRSSARMFTMWIWDETMGDDGRWVSKTEYGDPKAMIGMAQQLGRTVRLINQSN